jgi:hypothetical protein
VTIVGFVSVDTELRWQIRGFSEELPIGGSIVKFDKQFSVNSAFATLWPKRHDKLTLMLCGIEHPAFFGGMERVRTKNVAVIVHSFVKKSLQGTLGEISHA